MIHFLELIKSSFIKISKNLNRYKPEGDDF